MPGDLSGADGRGIKQSRHSPTAAAGTFIADSRRFDRRAGANYRRLPAARRHVFDAVARGRADRPDDYRYFSRKPDARLDATAAVGRGRDSGRGHLPPIVGKRGPARTRESGSLSRPRAGNRAGVAGIQTAQRRLGRALSPGLCHGDQVSRGEPRGERRRRAVARGCPPDANWNRRNDSRRPSNCDWSISSARPASCAW